MRSFVRTLSFCLATALPLAAVAQNAFTGVATGTYAPPSLKFSELSTDFKPMRLRTSGESSPGMMGGLTGIMMMAGMTGGRNADQTMPAMIQVASLNDLCWTKGETVSVAGQNFLVTYKLNTGLDTTTLSGASPKMAASLTLNLLRTDSITSISPVPDMTPDSLRKLLSSAGVVVDKAPLQTDTRSSDEATTAAILVPVFAQAKQAAKHTAALSNAKQLATAALIYSADHDDVFPYVQSTGQFAKVTYPYYKNEALWKTQNPNGGGFRFAMNLAGVSGTTIENPAEAPLIFETNAWPDGRRVVAFADGHAKRVTAEEWKRIEPRLKKKYPRTAKWPIKF